MDKKLIAVVGIVLVLLVFGTYKLSSRSKSAGVIPTPTPATTVQLPADKQPQASLTFSSDGHYVTVSLSNVYSDSLEYNLIYDATVKKTQIQSGVTGGAKLDGKNTYSYKQLLGSESSGKFTYHESIKNAVMELTLRDASKYSIFSATYPFEIASGKTIALTPSD